MRPERLLQQLEECKVRFDPRGRTSVAALLSRAKSVEFRSADLLSRFHEVLLYIRAYPGSAAMLRAADDLLSRFASRVETLKRRGVNLTPLEEGELSGISGSGLTAVFSHALARDLARRHPGCVSIAWDAYDQWEQMLHTLPHLIPFLDDDAEVEAHVPYREWIRAAARGRDELNWLLDGLGRRFPDEREARERYESLGLPLRWEFGGSSASRSLMRLPCRVPFFHTGPLIQRKEISLDALPFSPDLPVRKLSRREGELMLALARDTSAVRYRMLHGFTFGDPNHVYEIQAGRGTVFYLNGVVPEQRLSLRAYHSMTLWKNGVATGYFEGLSVCERMEAGFNLYYTFREGETAWLYGQVLRALRQMLGVTCFRLDPYQIGHENQEGLESGAFWFYRKLGFRPVEPPVVKLMRREETRIASQPGYRTPLSALRRLVRGAMIYEFSGSDRGAWDRFDARRAGMAAASGADSDLRRLWRLLPGYRRWSASERTAADRVARVKYADEEAEYLRLMQAHPRLRAGLIQLGSRAADLTPDAEQ